MVDGISPVRNMVQQLAKSLNYKKIINSHSNVLLSSVSRLCQGAMHDIGGNDMGEMTVEGKKGSFLK